MCSAIEMSVIEMEEKKTNETKVSYFVDHHWVMEY